jgi:alkylation response protein AidB-like acyl-CoA dehydrogenase
MSLTHEEAIKRAKYVGQIAEEDLFEADRNGVYPSRLKDAIKETQLHRLLRPKRYGGFGLGYDTLAEVTRTVAYHSVAGAWVTSFMPAHEGWVALLPPAGREEIFSSDEFVADIFFPMGTAEIVEGGLRLSGQWKWGSGIDFCGWIGLGVIVEVPGTAGPQPCLATIKVAEGEIVRDWDAMGSRASGSNGIKVSDVFVPWHRVFPAGSVKNAAQPLGGEFDPREPVYRVPYMPAGAMATFSAISIGASQRLINELHDRLHARQRVVLGMKEWESPLAQRNLGEVTTWLEQIEALYARYGRQIAAWSDEGKAQVSDEESGQLGAWRAMIARTASHIGFRTIELLGAAATYKGDLVEIFARDLFMVSLHVTQSYEDHMLFYGRTQYGLSGHPIG